MRTRRELGETVGALAEKLDVKSQAREQINVTKDRIAEQSSEARQHAARFIGRVDRCRRSRRDRSPPPSQPGSSVRCFSRLLFEERSSPVSKPS
ncbi:uncharacterized protein DUF3618 [Nesterenkonia aurantiaca]|uniref:Uncharacterized protein DUF3618 n=1 Tax=Nesterenkonia aurantiaca TaxID=1436010 RepID=A0A4R7FXZ0_9MICC|nr:uncharacterized protein DUF3618 [Nesterenkonia aurantiaca]